MSPIWPIPPLPMLCWCWNHWNHFHLFLVFLVTRHLSCTNLIIRTIIYHHISMLSYSHILSYSHSLIFPDVPRYSDTISHRHLPCPHHILTGTCPVLCSSNGEYEEGACRCYPGWKGAECSIRHNECEVSLLNRIVHSA